MTPLYLVRFIEDTEGPFILRLRGELKVLNVLCHNLPVGDEVALGSSPAVAWVRHKAEAHLLALGPETQTVTT